MWRLADGSVHQQYCGPSAAYADQVKHQKLEELWAGRLGIGHECTWDEFSKEFLEVAKRERAPDTYRKFYLPVIEPFGLLIKGKALKSISTQDIAQYKQYLYERQMSPTSINMRMRAIRAMFNYAIKMKYIHENPVAGVSMPRATAAGRIIQDHEFAKLLPALPVLARRMVTVLMYTGMRLGELLSLEWDDIKFGNPPMIVLKAHKTKSRDQRAFVVHPTALEAIGLNRGHSGPFIGQNKHYLGMTIRKICKINGIPNIRIHDIRHTAATKYAEATGDIFGLLSTFGWKSTQIAKRYQHVTDKRLKGILKLKYDN